MKNRQGVSLLVLTVTIVLMIVLLTTSVVIAGNIIDNSRLSSFASEVFDVKDATEVYYAYNEEFPYLDEDKAYSKGEILALVEPEYQNVFLNELILNGDNASSDDMGSFYKIDLSKIDVEQTTRGIKKDGNERDVFVISYPSMNVYYLDGVAAKNTKFFSITSRVTTLVKISRPKEESLNGETTVTQSAGITVKREKKEWTNKVNMSIETNLESGETLYIQLDDGAEYSLTSTAGQNILRFYDNFSSYKSLVNNTSYNLSISSSDLNNFNSLAPENKFVYIIKKKSGVVTGKVKIDFSNYDVSSPVKIQSTQLFSSDDYNLITFKMQDSLSGIKEVRYEYLKEFDASGNIKYYYDNVTSYDVAYMKTRGKKATVSKDGTIEIKVPKDIEGIEVVAFDKAGNNSSMDPLPTENTTSKVYIGINKKNITLNEASFNFVFRTEYQIESAKASISIDGRNYTNEITLTPSKVSDEIYNATGNFANIDTTSPENLYVKVVATYLTNNVETRVKKIDIKNVDETLGEGTRIREESAWNKPYVPSDFHYVEGTVNEGYVIADENGNEFVWIPVDGVNVKYEKWCDKGYLYTECSDVPDSEYPEGITAATESEIVNNAGGFYIGRYEAGVPEGQSTIDGTSSSTSNTIGIPVSKKGATVWTYIDYTNANNNAKSYMNNDEVASGLLTGTAWDTVCKWLQNSGIDVNDSRTYGNYYNSQSSADISEAGNKQVTGYSEDWKVKNIYDFAGNTYEWTNEIYSRGRVLRGGSYGDNALEFPVCYRFGYILNGTAIGDGFRLHLYIK